MRTIYRLYRLTGHSASFAALMSALHLVRL